MTLRRFSGTRNKILLMVASFMLVVLVSISPGAAETIKRIIILETMPVPNVLEHTRWFVTQLKDMGYREGQNMNLTILKADGDRQKAKMLLKKSLARERPDIVVTNATLASQAAAKILQGTKIPLIFFTVSDPVGAGLIKKIGVPTGTNITGRVYTVDRTVKINMIMRLVGQTASKRPIRLGFIHSSYPSAVGDLRELQKIAAKREDVTIIPYRFAYRQFPEGMPAMIIDVQKGIAALKGKADFWIEPLGPLGEVREYTKTLSDYSSLPIVMGTKLDSVKMGALLSVTPAIEASGRETAMLADAILKGTDPGKIPVTPPASFQIGINLMTALKMKIVVPQELLELAGSNVYR